MFFKMFFIILTIRSGSQAEPKTLGSGEQSRSRFLGSDGQYLPNAVESGGQAKSNLIILGLAVILDLTTFDIKSSKDHVFMVLQDHL